MVFSSFTYVFFLMIVVLLYWKCPHSWRIPLLLIASYVFYMAWSPPFGIIYAPVIFFDSVYFYLLSVAMVRWPQYKKGILTFGITTELCILGYFKYANFLINSFQGLADLCHIAHPHLQVNVFLPLAISFTNFVLISYLVDVYRGDERPDPSFIRFAAYVAFFPHLIAGPIVRAKELLHQFSRRHAFSWDLILKGIDLFLMGLFVKLCIADTLAPFIDAVFNNPKIQGFDTNWVALYSFAIQIFCDFLGYTLMAQGSAIMMGLTLPDNFDAPYFSATIQDFWRRWHMSLSRWLRDYLYIPLGGSRTTPAKTKRNLYITMGLGGLWHGANWTFVIWGLYQGFLLSLERLGEQWGINRFIPTVMGVFLTFHAVCLGWILFRAQSFPQAAVFFQGLFNPFHKAGLFHNEAVAGGSQALAIVVMFFTGHWLYRNYGRLILQQPLTAAVCRTGAYFVLIYLGLTLEHQSQPFIYFQF